MSVGITGVRTIFRHIDAVCLLVMSVLQLLAGQAYAEEARFSATVWKNTLTTGIFCRNDEFRKFLRDYNLIGMSRAQVSLLLSTKDRADGYLISCGPDSLTELQIEYENDKVKQWRFNGFSKKGHWQTTNVLWMPNGFVSKEQSSGARKREKSRDVSTENPPAR